ncbi:MAG: hypothetical protein C5B59_12780 [Bacteroidetes bacterium]|nr:MAG: hypothetical protein C5B59_12780 [Bacteroidota bacterium]
MCIETCIHLDITDELIARAEADEKGLMKQHQQEDTYLPLNKRPFFIGALAQYGVFELLDDWKVPFIRSAYFDPARHGDRYDFVYEEMLHDIQGQVVKPDWPEVYPRTRFFVKNQKKDKPMDRYVFVLVDEPALKLHIAGVATHDQVWDNEQTMILKNDCHYVLANQLKGLRQHILHI